MIASPGMDQRLRVLCCAVAGQTYGLAMAYVSGIQRAERLAGQPGAQGLVGYIPDGERVLPVFSLAARLDQPQAEAGPSDKIVLLKAQPRPWALHVEDVEGVIQVATNDICALPALTQPRPARLFEAVIHYESRLLLALSPAGLSPYGPWRQTALFQPLQRTVSSLPPAPEAPGQILSFATVEAAEAERSWCFALSLSQVSQILHAQPLLPVPGTPASVLGLAWWREAPLAVVDLSRCLGGAVSLDHAAGRLLVARAASTQAFAGFPVCTDMHLWQLPLAHRPSTRPLPLQTSLIRGQFDLGSITLVVPDIDGIMLPQELLSC